jgi:hypothetical protein
MSEVGVGTRPTISVWANEIRPHQNSSIQTLVFFVSALFFVFSPTPSLLLARCPLAW